MTEISSIEKTVMRRVRRIRILRSVFSAFTASCVVLLLALWGIGREVWVAKVFANGPQDLLGRAWYLSYAFEHTHLIVQALSLFALASLIYLARATARLIASLLFAPVRAA